MLHCNVTTCPLSSPVAANASLERVTQPNWPTQTSANHCLWWNGKVWLFSLMWCVTIKPQKWGELGKTGLVRRIKMTSISVWEVQAHCCFPEKVSWVETVLWALLNFSCRRRSLSHKKSLPLKAAPSGSAPKLNLPTCSTQCTTHLFNSAFPSARTDQHLCGWRWKTQPCDIYMPRWEDLKRGLGRLAWHLRVPGCQGGILYWNSCLGNI